MRTQKPSSAFVGASRVALGIGMIGFISGLWRSRMLFNEKSYFFTVLMFFVIAVVSVQKSVRDRLENVKVSDLYYGIFWFVTILTISLLVIGLWNAEMMNSEKGFFVFSFILALFGAIAVQKNTRDTMEADESLC